MDAAFGGNLDPNESPRQVLPDLASWDVRRYGGTQIAIRSVSRSDAPASASGEGLFDVQR